LFNLLFIFFIFQTIKIKGNIIKNWKKNLALFIYGGKEEKITGVKIKEKKKIKRRKRRRISPHKIHRSCIYTTRYFKRSHHRDDFNDIKVAIKAQRKPNTSF